VFDHPAKAAHRPKPTLDPRIPSPSDRSPPPDPRSVLLFVFGVAVLFLFGGVALQLLLGQGGLLAAEWLLLFVPAMLWVRSSGFDSVRLLSLRRPGAPALVGGLLLGAGALPLVWVIGWLQTFILPVPTEVLEGLEELVRTDSPARLVWVLAAFAATPAVCEEMLFRGVLLGGTRTLRPWRMILLNGVVFGAFHLSLSTVVRFLPTAALGSVIAWGVWRTGSIWVGVAMHFVNNAAIIVLASIPALEDAFSDPRAAPPAMSVVAGGITFAAGLGILLRTRPATGDPTIPPTTGT
jgi:sodium transport system permease protein